MMLTDNPVFAVGMMLAGLAASTVWYGFRLKKNHLPAGGAVLAALFGSLLALVCAKAAYLLHDLGSNIIEGYFDEVTELSAGTFSFIGGAAGFIAGTAAAARVCGIRPAKALDLFAAPGCISICLARLAEGGMDTIGTGSEVVTEWLKFFPLTMQNSWGDAYLCVFFLEALWALACLIPALSRKGGYREGDVFRRTAVWLLGAQIGWEMLVLYPYIRALVTSFVSLEQVLCAVLFTALVIRGCAANKKWWPLIVTVLLLGISALFQFYRDGKIEFLFEEGWEWAVEKADGIARAAFCLISAGLILTGEKAILPDRKHKM